MFGGIFKSCSAIMQAIYYMLASHKFHLAHTHIQTLLMGNPKPIVALSPCVSVHFHGRFLSTDRMYSSFKVY